MQLHPVDMRYLGRMFERIWAVKRQFFRKRNSVAPLGSIVHSDAKAKDVQTAITQVCQILT
jgi:hypothetical protein